MLSFIPAITEAKVKRTGSNRDGKTRRPAAGNKSVAITLRHTTAGQVLRALTIIGIGAGLVYLVQFAEFASVMFEVFSGINSTSEAVANHRGDKVDVRTEFSGRRSDPDKTVVRLRRAHRWFWTTLVETDSFGVQEHLEWKNDDALEVTLGFGCVTQMTRPVQDVGSIRISYHFSNGEKGLSKRCPD
jgi:hypothetical protein